MVMVCLSEDLKLNGLETSKKLSITRTNRAKKATKALCL